MKLSTSNCRSRSKPAVNRPFSEVGLPEELTTLPEALGEAGYTQRHIVGKWHLGNMRNAQLPMIEAKPKGWKPFPNWKPVE